MLVHEHPSELAAVDRSGGGLDGRHAGECTPRLTFRIPQPHNGRIVKVLAYIDGRLVKRVSGHRVKRLTLKTPTKANFTVRIVKVSDRGRRTASVRTYRGCHKTRPQRG